MNIGDIVYYLPGFVVLKARTVSIEDSFVYLDFTEFGRLDRKDWRGKRCNVFVSEEEANKELFIKKLYGAGFS